MSYAVAKFTVLCVLKCTVILHVHVYHVFLFRAKYDQYGFSLVPVTAQEDVDARADSLARLSNEISAKTSVGI